MTLSKSTQEKKRKRDERRHTLRDNMVKFLEYVIPGVTLEGACAASGLKIGHVRYWRDTGKKFIEDPEFKPRMDKNKKSLYIWFAEQCERKRLAIAANIQKERVDAALNGDTDIGLKILQEMERKAFNPTQNVNIKKTEEKTITHRLVELQKLTPEERSNKIKERAEKLGIKLIEMDKNDDEKYEKSTRTGT